MRKPKPTTAPETRPNAHLEERSASVRSGKGKLLKPKAETAPAVEADPPPQQALPTTEQQKDTPKPLGTVSVSANTHPDAYGLVVDENGLGLHAAPGASIIVEPVMPAKAGLAVFYMKGQPNPTIFDLTRSFQPDLAAPHAPGSEVTYLIELCVPETGQVGHIRADRVATIHKVRGIYSPTETAIAHRRAPPALPETAECPEGMGEHYVEGAAAYPLVRPGETVIYDPSQREPTPGALCVLQWTNGTRDVLQTNRRRVGGWDEEGWFVDPVNRPSSRAMLERRLASGSPGLLYASDGPYTEEHLRERIVGTVVAILVFKRTVSEPHAAMPALPAPAPAARTSAQPDPSTLVQACDQAVRDWHAIQPASRAEDWGDDQLDKALDSYDAIFRRAIGEPSRDVSDLQAKARLLLHDLLAHDPDQGSNDEPGPTVDEQLTRVILREVAGLSDCVALAAGPDPVFKAIERHSKARAACAGLDDGVDKAAYEAGHDRRIEALNAVESTLPTTLAGLLALARHMDTYLREGSLGQDYLDGTDNDRAFGGLMAACLSLSERLQIGVVPANLPDPIFAAIRAHADARAAFAETVNPQDTAWVRERGGDTSDEAMAPANAAYETASAAEGQAWAALFEARPTTLPGVLALLRHCQAWAPSNDGQDGAPAMEDVFGIIADALQGFVTGAAPEVMGHLLQDDPVFAAIAEAEKADAAMAAFDKDPAAYQAEDAGAVEDRLCDAQSDAYRAVLATAPTTTAGLRALVECTKKQLALILGEGWQAEIKKDMLSDAYLSLVNAIEAVHGNHTERHDPVTVESAAGLSFEAYTFDTPLRSPQEWTAEFAFHAIPMHAADKTLRMTKPEMMDFVRGAIARGDGTDELLWKGLNAASSTFDGWAKLMHLAASRYLIAGASVAAETETEKGGA